MFTETVPAKYSAGASQVSNRLERIAYHEAGHAVMALMYGYYIKSVSIIEDRRRGHFGMVRAIGIGDSSHEADLLCMLAGPIAELLYLGKAEFSFDVLCDLHQSAELEGLFDRQKDRPNVTMNRFVKTASICIEVMADSDFRGAVDLLASRLIKHRYLSHERVIRQKDSALWDIYSTSAARVRHAKRTPSRVVRQMMRNNPANDAEQPRTRPQSDKPPSIIRKAPTARQQAA
jgi:hypothetical protein